MSEGQGTVGIDIGTMNLISAVSNPSDGSIKTKSLRNVFLEVSKASDGTIDLAKVYHTVIDGIIYVLSGDAYKFANIFNKEISRPMKTGLLNPAFLDSSEILGTMIRDLVGKNTNGDVCAFSVPAPSVDHENDIVYHRGMIQKIIKSLGYKPLAVNEGAAVIFSECPVDKTGIGISFGAGMTNVAVVYQGMPGMTFSIARGGDWIDHSTSRSLNGLDSRITAIKESGFDINDARVGTKRERKIREAISLYYAELVEYVINNIIIQLTNTEIELPVSLPIVLSGGTCKAKGFTTMVKNILDGYELPFEVSEVRRATEPLEAVAKGCLAQALK